MKQADQPAMSIIHTPRTGSLRGIFSAPMMQLEKGVRVCMYMQYHKQAPSGAAGLSSQLIVGSRGA